ncbi:Replicative DNA helicase [Burkholderia gladioli]|uniref:replicative DNA helicase n=1 Tax=Burkholderia gladioli TaxID=28095 RepID=UPI001CB09DAE|nr:replicative DNA helicase [Burkholderia gladioli]CAG9205574.1 Replicative DNA helicase [Burkholderia gladioli]
MNAPYETLPDGLAVPPHSDEAEQSVLGALMFDNSAFDRIAELRPEHFYRFDHRLIFGAVTKLIVASKEADLMTVLETLQAAGKADDVGGMAYLNALVQGAPGSAGIARWAEIIINRWRMREMIATADLMSSMAFQPAGKTAEQILGAMQSKLDALAEIRAFEPQLPGHALTEIVEEIDARFHGAPLAVTSTGLSALDQKLGGGLRGSELVIVAGRPSMGKTAIAMGMGGCVAENGGTVLVFSMEMSAKSLHQRNLARVGGINLGHILDGRRMTDEEWPRLTHAVSVMAGVTLLVDDTPSLSLAEIVSRSRTVKRKHGLALVIVDYLGLMTGGTDERHDLKIGSYSSGLKSLAKQLDVPVIALAQLNRGVENRPNKRPTMADLRDSGAIEQDADVILMLYRDQVYFPDSPDRGTAEIIVGKQRNGETGSVRVAFEGEFQRFSDLPAGYVAAPRKEPEHARRGFE